MSSPVDILLVDDEARNLDALEAILDDPGYRLLRAQDADSALHLLLKVDVAAIVLDIKMPGVSGVELAKMIKNTKRFQRTPIVLLTAYMLDEQHVIAGYGAGAVDYLIKPVNPQILRHKVSVFADLFRKTRDLAQLNDTLEERVKERTNELAKSEAALRAAAAQKDEFLAVLAHELRNPLAPLRTGLDLLLRRQNAAADPDAGTARTLGAMNRQLDHMVRLIDDLLDISRLSRGSLELKREQVDVGALVDTTVEAARTLFERRRQTVTTAVATGIEANVDATRIAQIVTNLLHNAVKFTPEGGDVRVELARAAGDRVVIRVIDKGVGIPVDQLDRIFDMFARIERPGVVAEPGLGIGLALARRLAEMHGGVLTARSPGSHQGTTFELSLPLAAAPGPTASAQAPPIPPPAPAPPGGDPAALKVLVIEDNEDVSETMSEWLRDLGHQVFVASTGRKGVSLIEEVSPHLVLCDLGLPEMDGVEVCRRVRALPSSARQPVMVALTGWGRDEDRNRTQLAGFDHHLVKPVKADQLHRVLKSVSPPG